MSCVRHVQVAARRVSIAAIPRSTGAPASADKVRARVCSLKHFYTEIKRIEKMTRCVLNPQVKEVPAADVEKLGLKSPRYVAGSEAFMWNPD